MMQAFQPPSAAATAGATEVIGAAGSQLNAVCGMRNTLLVAADSVTDAMSSLVKELNSGLYAVCQLLVIVMLQLPLNL